MVKVTLLSQSSALGRSAFRELSRAWPNNSLSSGYIFLSWTLLKVIFTVRTITHWNNLPRDMSLKVLKMQSDRMLVNDDFMILSPHLRSISPKKARPDHLWRCLPAWAVLWFWGYWETEEGHFYVTTSMQAITCKYLLIIPSKITWNQPLPERQDPIPWMGIWRPGSKGGMPDPLRVQKPRGSH